MKIAIDFGHNSPPDVGCAGLSPEYPTEDKLVREIAAKVRQGLDKLGHKIINCYPGSVSSVSESLRKRCTIANEANADYFISIHMNCFNKSAHGTEQYAMSPKGYRLANKIQENLVREGFANRGVKDGSHLYVVKRTDAPAVLVEVCFCDSKRDMIKLDIDRVSSAIIEAINDMD